MVTMQTTPWRSLAARLAEALAGGHPPTELAQTLYAVVSRYVRYDFACVAITDPATGLVTWASKSRPLGVGDEEFAATEYGPPDINSFAELTTRTPPVGVLSIDTQGHPELCRRHRDLMLPRFGFTDELRVVFRDRGVSWGAMALYRGPGDPPFTAADADHFTDATTLVGAAVARSHFRNAPAGGATGPVATTGVEAVLIIDPSDVATHLTASADAAVEALGGWDNGSLPAGILAVVVSARTRQAPTETMVHPPGGRWLTVRAAPLSGPSSGGDVVVTITTTPPTALSRLALTAHGLTNREEEVAVLVLQGASTRAIADTLHLSPHTVQDHLKKIFTKCGVSSRRDLTAALVLR